MKNSLSFVALTVVVYLISWSVAYVLLVGSDSKYYLEYLRLAWTSPGEIPAFLQIASIIATVLIMLVVALVARHKKSGM